MPSRHELECAGYVVNEFSVSRHISTMLQNHLNGTVGNAQRFLV